MIRRPPRSTRKESSAASDVYKRQVPRVVAIVTFESLSESQVENLFKFDSAFKEKGERASIATSNNFLMVMNNLFENK